MNNNNYYKKYLIYKTKYHLCKINIQKGGDKHTTLTADVKQVLSNYLKKLQKDNINLKKDFFIFTGSTVGVVPILGKGEYIGKIDKLGTAKAIIS